MVLNVVCTCVLSYVLSIHTTILIPGIDLPLSCVVHIVSVYSILYVLTFSSLSYFLFICSNVLDGKYVTLITLNKSCGMFGIKRVSSWKGSGIRI